MLTSAGIGGAFGLLLPEFPKVAVIYGDLKLVVNRALEGKGAGILVIWRAPPRCSGFAIGSLSRLRRSASSFRRQPHCSGLAPRLIAWLDARLRPTSGSSDSGYSRTLGTIRLWMSPLGRTPPFIPGRGRSSRAVSASGLRAGPGQWLPAGNCGGGTSPEIIILVIMRWRGIITR